jgi:nitrite reductase/ring-hydroxylating ferredoxin subunit
MRVRLLLVLAIVLVLVVPVVAVVALWGGGPGRSGVVSVNLAGLDTGSARAVELPLPDAHHTDARIFLARSSSREVHAFLGVSTHLGCRLLTPGDARYGDGFMITSRRHFFEDPCGGSTYSLDGDCTGGPCPRGLDRYPVDVRDGDVDVDLNHLITGTARS